MGIGLFDGLTLAVAAIGYAMGRSKGFVWQLSGIATLILGSVCATILATPVGGLIRPGVLGEFVAWLAVYLSVTVCLYVLTLRLKRRLDDWDLEELDRRFGGVLGATKGLLAFALVVLLAIALAPSLERSLHGSVSGQVLKSCVHELSPHLPERLGRAFADSPPSPAPPAPAPASKPAPKPSKRPRESSEAAPLPQDPTGEPEAQLEALAPPHEEAREPEELPPPRVREALEGEAEDPLAPPRRAAQDPVGLERDPLAPE